MQRQLEALRRPLLRAAGSDPRRVKGGDELGAALRKACDRALAVVPEGERGAFEAWRRRLEAFEELGPSEKAVEVQRGLRLCQGVAGPAPKRRAAAASADGLAAPVTALPGIGAATAEKLADRGIETVEDLAWLVPARYDDLRAVPPVSRALAAAREDGDRAALWGEVASCRVGRRGARRWIDVRVTCADEAAEPAAVAVRFFNVPPGMASRFPRGARVALAGVLRRRRGAWEMANPEVLSVGEPGSEPPAAGAEPAIRPRYPDVAGVPASVLRRACRAAAERARERVTDGVPAAIAGRHDLPALGESLSRLHSPPAELSDAEAAALCAGESRWHKRLAFDELFVLSLCIARRRRERTAGSAPACPIPADRDEAIEGALSFSLTGAQERALRSIERDLSGERPMNRLLHGEVGSGKTAVAFAAARQVVRAGHQVALMAPTEILAEQHARSLEPWCRALGIRAAVFTASMPRARRRTSESMLAAGRIDVAIGTHALLAEGLRFSSLGLAIVDEQHRFGVAQRARLRDKGEGVTPHLLVMTATPIPRTLALTAYGDLDVSVLDEVPPGRRPPTTRALAGAEARRRVYARLRARLEAGHRAFVVCPLAAPKEEPADGDPADATSVCEELADLLAPAKVGLVHGRMTAQVRERQMAALRRGELDVLVATTVVEVGVDVPEATVMIVEDAERFGLAQLHQLRGRVGRGGGEAHCILLSRADLAGEGARRLKALTATSDGFRIAEEDLALRGPGELFGPRQAGIPRLRFGDLRAHADLLATAKVEADRLLEADPALVKPEHDSLARVLAARADTGQVFGSDAG